MEFHIFKNAFTLAELLVIIGIISALTLFAVPALRTFQPTLQLSSIVQEVVGDLRYAQQLTVTEQKEHCLQFFPTDKKYQLKKCEGEIIKEKIFPKEIESFLVSGFADNEVRYNPYGAVKDAGTIILENTKNEIKIISVKASGFISVTD